MWLWRISFFWMALALSGWAAASGKPSDISFERRVWTPIEGAPSGAWKIAQTDDGLLWFASTSGLYRFDGEKFRRVESIYGSEIPPRSLGQVAALKRGLALIYQFGGLSIFTDKGVRHYDVKDGLPAGNVRSVVETDDGELYVGTARGVAKLAGAAWELLRDTGLPNENVDRILQDKSGTIWVAVEGALYARPPGSKMFARYIGSGLAKWTEPELILGKVVVTSADRRVLQAEFGRKPLVLFDKLSSDIDNVFEGPASTLFAWLGDQGGLVRLRQQHDGSYAIAESFEAGRPPNSAVLVSLVDREGNVWISTLNGVERLRAQRVHDIPVPGTVFLPSIHRGLGDAVLVSGVTSPQVLTVAGPRNAEVTQLANIIATWRENADSLWAGGFGSYLYHITPHGLHQWPLPVKLLNWQGVQSIAVDHEGGVWVSIIRGGLYRFFEGRWTKIDIRAEGGDTYPLILYVGPSGRVLLGFPGSRIAEIKDGALRLLASSPTDSIGTVLSLIEVDGHLIAGGENGLMWVGPHGNQALWPEQIKVFRGVAGLVVDRQGDLWAHGIDGIYRIPKDELSQFWGDPQRRLKWEVLSLADGVRGNAAAVRPLPSLMMANDGRLYYATNSQAGWIDPAHLRRNTRVPDVMILGVHTRDGERTARGAMTLDAGTTALEIRYAVTALSVPEKVRIKYRLSGVDQEWQAPAGERVARYTNLEPGSYTFRVIAANEDGVWNNEGATLQFNILPEFWQTLWFRLIVLALLLAASIAFHRWRVITTAARAAERTAARLEERERIARNLHDNLLQGVHALVLRSGTILNRLPKGSQEELILEDVLGQADKLIENTRDELMALRDSQTAEQAVDELRRDLERMEPLSSGRVALAIAGRIARIRPEVARELCQVLKEAVNNAVCHSGASEIHAWLSVTADGIEGGVLDNGTGIPAEIAERGLAGHWGIIGMRERITKLGGTMTIARRDQAGTALQFVLTSVPVFN